MLRSASLALVAFVLASCSRPAPSNARAGDSLAGITRLPTGETLDPDGRQIDLGSMPLGMVVSPEGDRVAVMLSGWREQGVQIVDPVNGAVTQTLLQPAGFIGLAFSPDGRSLYASGGNQDVVYRYAWSNRQATLQDSVVLGVERRRGQGGSRYPAGLALSADGRTLYVAENLADSLAVVDVASGKVVQRLATERYPYQPVVGPGGEVYVSAWGGNTVSAFRPEAGSSRLTSSGRWHVVRHPSALLLSRDGSRLFVASGSTDKIGVVDTKTGRTIRELSDAAPAGPSEGSTPNALALSPDGTRLYVAEADNNAAALFDLSATTSGVSTAAGTDTIAGRVPAGWYPTAVAVRNDTLLVLNGKGRGTGPNRDLAQPNRPRLPPRAYTLGQTSGTLTVSLNARTRGPGLARLSTRTANANNWGAARNGNAYPPIRYVVYVIKENRTYDQVFGDETQADGDTSLSFFPRSVSPNHHALAERFGLFDRFFVNAEVSPDGHNWSTAAYATDYLEKTVPSNYSSRGRSYDYEGTNRNRVPADEGQEDAAEPARGYLWDDAQRAGLSMRNYGEFVVPDRTGANASLPPGYRGDKPFLAANTNRDYPGFDLSIPDQHRADVFIAEFNKFVQSNTVPRLMILRLPNDHTSGAARGAPSPKAHFADNDLALGRIVAAISKSPIWRETAIFVLEDDAQNGPDHVDSHRSPFMAISPWSRRGVNHRFTNTTDVLATIEGILGLSSMSQFDHYGRPLRDIWTDKPDFSPYVALTPSQSLQEQNPSSGDGARDSQRLRLDVEDMADENLFNRILWRAIKGPEVPYPGPTRMSSLEWKRSR